MYQKKDLEKILPHKFPMILIDRIIGYDLESKSLTAEVEIKSDTLFFNPKTNQMPIEVGMEYMAQTVGALSGIYSSQFKKSEVKLGFVIGARNFECFASGFDLGKILTIKVSELFFDSELGAFNCEIFDNNKKLAQAQLNVFQPNSVENFFQNYE